jgi:polysaccharide pyruvyl transferase WcaK-like protein
LDALSRVIHFCRLADDNIGEIAIRCSIRDMLHSRLGMSVYTPTEITELKKPQPFGFTELVNQHDICIIGGGGLYSKYFLPLDTRVIESIEIPIVLYGVGYIRNFGDGEPTETQVENIRLLNARAELTSVRDEFTRKFLEKLGVDGVHLIGDPAIFIGARKTHQVNSERGTRIGVNVACHFWTWYPRYLRKTIREYIRACKSLLKTRDTEIIYLMHHPDEKLAIRLMEKRLPLKVVNTNRDPYEMRDVYGKLDLVIGMMMHSAVLAFGSGVPMVNIAYDCKNYGFMELIGQKDKVINVGEVTSKEICELATRSLEDSKGIGKSFQALKNELWEKQRNFLTEIEKLLA